LNLVKHWAAQLDDYAIDLAWSPDGATLAAASSAGPISLFSAADGAEKYELPGHSPGTNAIAFMPEVGRRAPATPVPLQRQEIVANSDTEPNGRRGGAPPHPTLASAGQDGAVKFWDASSGHHTATAPLGAAWVEHLAWCPGSDSPPLLAAVAGRKLVLLTPDGAPAHTFADVPKTISALACHPASRLLAIAFFGGVRLIAASDCSLHKEFPYANGIHALVWSPDGKWLVSGNQDPSVHLWIPAQDAELQMSGYESKVKHLSFDTSSRWLATAGGRDACVWDCAGAGPEGRAPAMFQHDSPVCALAFQNSHGLLATASQGGEVQLWSPERRQPLRAAARLPAAVTKLAWSPDDRTLAIGSEKGIVYVLTCEA